MLRFMTHNIEDTVESLREENLELKLGSIKKELATFKVDMHRHLDLILEQTSKTNGSVARSMERINALERHDTMAKIEILEKKIDTIREETKPFRVITTNKWVRILIVTLISLIGLQGITGLSIAEILKMI